MRGLDLVLPARVPVERNELDQRAVSDHHAGRMDGGVAEQAFDADGEVEQPSTVLFLVDGRAKAFQRVPGLRKRHRLRGIVRDLVRDPVGLASRHAEHASGVVQRRARLQRVERHDLRDMFGAVALANVFDDLVPADFAEVDVEVRHRDALGVQEALEEQPVANGVEVHDPKRVRDQRTRARTPPRPDRNVALLRPVDEVGDDQEVAGEVHVDDDVEFEFQTLPVDLRFGGRLDNGEPALEPPLRFVPEELRFVFGEARKNRLPLLREERDSPCDVRGVVERFGEVREAGAEVLGAAEPVFRRVADVVRLFPVPCRDSAEYAVGRVEPGVREIGFRRRDQGKAERVCQVEKRGLGPGFRSGTGSAAGSVALNLHIQAVRKRPGQTLQKQPRGIVLAVEEKRADRAPGASGQADQVCRVRFESLQVEGRADCGCAFLSGLPGVIVSVQIHSGDELQEIAETRLRLGEQHDRRRLAGIPGEAGAALTNADRAADQGLNSGSGERGGEVQGAEQVGGIGDACGRHALGLAEPGNLGYSQRSLERGVIGEQSKMDDGSPGSVRFQSLLLIRAVPHGLSPGSGDSPSGRVVTG